VRGEVPKADESVGRAVLRAARARLDRERQLPQGIGETDSLRRIALKPVPPLAAPPKARGIDLHSDEDLDERQLKAWLRQAEKLPGWGRVD
jgi:hypothetical protein